MMMVLRREWRKLRSKHLKVSKLRLLEGSILIWNLSLKVKLDSQLESLGCNMSRTVKINLRNGLKVIMVSRKVQIRSNKVLMNLKMIYML